MPQGNIKGTVIQFIPKGYQRVPSVQDLMNYYTQHKLSLDDNRALGIVILDDNEKKHTLYVSVSFLMNHLNHMKDPIQVRSRLDISYGTTSEGGNIIQNLKLLPVFFQRNQAHDKDKSVPEYIRRGDRRDDKAQELTSFNPLLPVPHNIEANDDKTTKVLSHDDIKNFRDVKTSMHDAFMTTLDHSQFRQRTDQLFQAGQEQAQRIIDSIFDKDYLSFTDQFNQVHEDDFVLTHSKKSTDDNTKKSKRLQDIDSVDL